ncbi:MAG: pyrroline-5-carboxylate reductase, partial [Anaerolineae bacterium]|nr:pyrroline-5-carboxylate reductase [Anaerolineae bacterium]
TAMGPTYLWFQWQSLRELATGFGLEPAVADRALRQMIVGAADLLLRSGRAPAEVMDLVPVKPLKDDEPTISAVYRSRLVGLYEKIRP